MQLINYFYNKIFFFIAYLRALFWKIFMKHVGEKVVILDHCMITSPQSISLGDNTFIGKFVSLNGKGSLTIGSNVLIGSFTQILTTSHNYNSRERNINAQGYLYKPIIIEDDVWIGTHVTILPGVTIAKGAVIGANSLVTKNVKPYCVMGGVPAKYIKMRGK